MNVNPATFIQQENARLREENEALQKEAQSLREFVRILDELHSAADHFENDAQLMPFLKRTLQKAMDLLQAPDGSLALLDEETDELVFVIVNGQLAGRLTGYRLSIQDGIAGWVVRHNRPALVRNVRTDPRFSNTIDHAFTFSTQSIAAAPLCGNQRVYGVIEVLNQRSDEPFSEDDLALLKLLCRAAGEALADMERIGQKE